MPRGPGGTYVLPSGNPVVPGTIIESNWANPTMADVGQEISDSLSRSGKGGMLAALRGLDGTAAVPTFSFTNEPSSGRYRDGPGQVVEAILGQPVVRYLATGLEQWDSDIMDWVPLTPRDALGTPFDPNPSNLTSTNVQDAIEEVNDKTGGAITADSVTYDDSNVYFPAATVQIAIDRLGTDVSGLANDILDNADAIQVLEGEFDLLEPRVQQNEINIGTNANNIALNTQQINANVTDIGNNANEISSIKLEQITQNSDILGNTAYIDNVFGITQTNAGNINTNTLNISQNAADILTTFNITQVNAGNITTNTGNITSNKAEIDLNTFGIGILEGYFNQPAGRLNPAYGGTGTTTGVASGTGNNVLSGAPTISGGEWLNMVMTNGSANGANLNNCNLDSNCDGVTQSPTVENTKLATTAYVHSVLENFDFAYIARGSNSNGWWYILAAAGDNNPRIYIQGGYKTAAGTGPTVTFPTAFPTAMQAITSNTFTNGSSLGGVDITSAVYSSVTTTSVRMTTNRNFYWIAIGH